MGETDRDTRRRAYGLGRILLLAHAAASAWLVLVLLQEVLVRPEGPARAGLALVLAALYAAASAGLVHNGRRMRRLAWIAGTLTLLAAAGPGVAADGADGPAAALVPIGLVLPVVGLAWLAWSRPGRVA